MGKQPKFDDSAVKHAKKKREASPDKDSVLKEFGRAGYSETPDGKWVVNLDNPEKVRRFSQMYEGARRLDKERGQEVRSKERRVRLVSKRTGKGIDLPDTHAEAAARKLGLVERWVPRGVVCVQGPDGMIFHEWGDGYTPTGKLPPGPLRRKDEAPDAEGRQRDPDGDVWIKVDGKWVLEGN